MRELENNFTMGIVHTAYDTIDQSDRIGIKKIANCQSMTPEEFLMEELRENCINSNTVMLRKQKTGFFKEKGDYCPIGWMVVQIAKWFEMVSQNNVGFLGEKLHVVRVSSKEDQTDLFSSLLGEEIQSFLEVREPKKDTETQIARILLKFKCNLAFLNRMTVLKEERSIWV